MQDPWIEGGSLNLWNTGEFNIAIMESGLEPVSFDGLKFTWTNGRVCQQLDRVLADEQRSTAYSTRRVSLLSWRRSNHCSLLIRAGVLPKACSSFLFLNVWKYHKDFLSIVQQALNQPVASEGMLSFFLKLMNTRQGMEQKSIWSSKLQGEGG